MVIYYVYLLHFSSPIGRRQGVILRLLRGLGPRKNHNITCQHYIGLCECLAIRIQEHRSGRGAKLTAWAKKLGIQFEIVRVWATDDPGLERRLKNQKNSKKLCPICTPNTKRERNDDELTPAEIKQALIPF